MESTIQEITQDTKPPEGTFIEEVFRCVQTPFHLLEGTEDHYKTADYWRQQYYGFPDEYYRILELKSNGVTPKEFKTMMKKERRKRLRKKGKNNKRV